MATGYGLDLPGDFDEDQAAVERRKLQLINAMKSPIGGAGTGLGGGLANFFQNAVGTHMLTGQDERSREIARQRESTARRALEEYGKLDKPAVPEVVGTGPIAPPPGTPGVEDAAPQPSMPAQGQTGPPEPIPQEAGWVGPGGGMVPQGAEFKANQAGSPMIPGSMSDKLSVLARVAQGGPMYAKIADKAMTQIVEAPEKEAARKAAAEDRAALAREAQSAREAERAKDRAQQEYLKTLTLNQQEQFKNMSQSQQEHMLRLAVALKPEKGGGAGGEGGSMMEVGTSAGGNPIVSNSKSGNRYEVINGVRSEVPYTGPTTPKTEQSKAVAAVSTGVKSIGDMQTALEAVTNNPRLYSKRTAAAEFLPNVGGLSASASGLNESELAQRANIQSMTADTTHSLYGSAFSAGEQAQARGFLIHPKDSAEVVKAKLKGRIELEQAHLANMPASARAVVEQRKAGGAPPAGKTVVKEVTIGGVTHHKYSDGSED